MNYTVYTKPGCPYCDKIKQVLGALGYTVEEQVLNVHFNRDDFYQKFGVGSTFPRVLEEGRLLGGCNETIAHLRNKGIV